MAGLPALIGALGLVAVGFGLLSLLLAFFQPVVDVLWAISNLGVGVLLLVVSVALGFEALGERLRSGEARRAGRYGTSAILSSLFAIAILSMLAFLSTRYSKSFDWTEDKVHTLTDQTLGLLEALDRDVQVTAFFTALDAPPVRELLERYATASGRFSLQFFDPNTRPDLLADYGIDEETVARGVVRMEMGDQSLNLSEFDEASLTNALLKLTREGNKKVYLVEGHNERAYEGEEGLGKEGFSRAVEALRNETYRVEKLLLAAHGEVPEDADAVVIAGPTRPFLAEEHAALDRYLERGGSLMVMIDPRANTDLYDGLQDRGVEIGDDVIFDPSLALFGRAASPFAGSYAEGHPITKDLREPALFHLARSVQATGGDAGLEAIVFTGENSWAERDLDGYRESGQAAYGADDLLGPVPVAVAGELPATDGAPPARLVVMGDSDFATNEFVESFLNRDLFVNSVNWLVGDVDQISVRPHISRASRFQLSNEQFRSIQWLSIFVVPEAIAVMGVLAWWTRRSRMEA